MKRSNEPFFWLLFSAGGMLAALALPVVAALVFFYLPLGPEPSHGDWLGLLAPPAVRAGLFVLVALAMFHWAHRFRFTLYDGLQLYHLYALIAVVCYGGAAAVTALAAWMLWTLP